MYTRLSTWTNAKNIDEGIDYFKETALPVLRQQKGYRGSTVSVDRSAQILGVLSVWESEADCDASESALAKARDEATDVIGGQRRVEKLEQLVAEMATPPGPKSALMVTPFSMDPAAVDHNLEFFKSEILPHIKSAPGFCAVRNMVNRSTGDGYVGTVWADKAAMDRQVEGSSSRRDVAGARGITFGEISYREILVVDTP